MARTKNVARKSTGGIAPVVKSSPEFPRKLAPKISPKALPPKGTRGETERIEIYDREYFLSRTARHITETLFPTLEGMLDIEIPEKQRKELYNDILADIETSIDRFAGGREEAAESESAEDTSEENESVEDVSTKSKPKSTTSKKPVVKAAPKRKVAAKDALPGPEAFSVAQLKTILKQKGVKFDAKAKKADLLALLQSSGDVADRKKAAPGKSNVQKVVTKACLREKDYESFLKGATVAELKQDLKEYGVEVTGKKDLLIARCMYCAGLSDTDPDQ